MYIYVTSTNSLMGEPTHTARMLYFGTDVGDAEKAVGLYADYPVDGFPNNSLLYSALPEETEREMIQFYQRSTIWCSIEMVKIDIPQEVLNKMVDAITPGNRYSPPKRRY